MKLHQSTPLSRRPSSVAVERAALAICAAGIALRLWQYLAAPSLWLDELGLVRNVLDRSLVELVGTPLDYYQLSPPLFVLSLGVITDLLGSGEHAFRLLPIVLGSAGVVLFYRVAVRFLDEGPLLLALATFAFGPTVIWYASLVKHYGSDVTASLAILLVALRWCEQPSGTRFLLLALVGSLAAFFSYAATLALAGVGLGLAAGALRRREQWPWIAALAGIWGTAAGGSVALGYLGLDPVNEAHQLLSWADGYMPFPPRSVDEALWLWRTVETSFSGTGWPVWPARVLAALTGLGAVVLVRRRPPGALLLAGPVLVGLAASAAQRYPLSYRPALFLLPIVIVAMATGVGALLPGPGSRWRPAGHALVAALLCAALWSLWKSPPVYRLQDTRRLYAYLRDHRQPGDAIYAYYGAWQSAAYYGPRHGIAPEEVTFGGCHTLDVRAYLREVDAFRGRPRVWVLMVHPRGYEERTILGYLRQIGLVIDGVDVPAHIRGVTAPDISARLFDLSAPRRLARWTAEDYPLPTLPPARARSAGCHGPSRPWDGHPEPADWGR